MIDKYLQMFGRLRTDKGRDRYPEITYHRAPHKPFLLLSILDLIAQGRISENLIEPSFELVDTFNTYWAAIVESRGRPMILRFRGRSFYHFLDLEGVSRVGP
jgi:putative restriction endonuclease